MPDPTNTLRMQLPCRVYILGRRDLRPGELPEPDRELRRERHRSWVGAGRSLRFFFWSCLLALAVRAVWLETADWFSGVRFGFLVVPFFAAAVIFVLVLTGGDAGSGSGGSKLSRLPHLELHVDRACLRRGRRRQEIALAEITKPGNGPARFRIEQDGTLLEIEVEAEAGQEFLRLARQVQA